MLKIHCMIKQEYINCTITNFTVLKATLKRFFSPDFSFFLTNFHKKGLFFGKDYFLKTDPDFSFYQKNVQKKICFLGRTIFKKLKTLIFKAKHGLKVCLSLK